MKDNIFITCTRTITNISANTYVAIRCNYTFLVPLYEVS